MEKTDFIKHIKVQGNDYQLVDINRLEEKGIAAVRQLPYSIKILVENLLRKLDGRVVREADLPDRVRTLSAAEPPFFLAIRAAV